MNVDKPRNASVARDQKLIPIQSRVFTCVVVFVYMAVGRFYKSDQGSPPPVTEALHKPQRLGEQGEEISQFFSPRLCDLYGCGYGSDAELR